MDVYSTEEEQVEAIKKWWKENGTAVIVGLSLGLGSLFGWRAWEANTVRTELEASQSYTQLMAHMSEKKYESATAMAEKLIADKADGAYAMLGRLSLAAIAVNAGEHDQAKEQLQIIIDQSNLDEVILTARIRLAQLYLADNDQDKAWSLINTNEPASKPLAYLHLKGDILAAKGDNEGAREAYTEATGMAQNISKEMVAVLELKLDNLGTADTTL